MLLRMKIILFTGVVFLIFAARMSGQLEYADEKTKAKCEKYSQTPLPAEASAIAHPKVWPECNSYKLYSGIGVKVDFGEARKCACLERLATQAGLEPRFSTASVFGGSAMLTVLYANGEGVPRDLSLALRFACEAGGAPGEIGGRLHSLEGLRGTTRVQAKVFDFCDDITSGFMEGFCAARASEVRDQDRAHSVKNITSQFTVGQRAAFDAFRKLEEAYALAHARGEIDLSGTARAMYQIDSEDTLRDDFLATLRSFEVGKFPSGSVVLYHDADSRLNSAYRKAITDAEAHKSDYGAVQPEGIRSAERAWLKYRDAWVAFARQRYPSVPEEAWLVLLSNDRTSVLDGSFCDMDAEDSPCAQHGDTWKPSPLP